MAEGIRDKVAILGMGCTRFGERWESGAEDLMVEALVECLEDAGIEKNEIEAAWVGTCYDEVNIGKAAVAHAEVLKLPHVAVTRVENFCATAQEALRGASYAVAAGTYYICLALGVEKLKDVGFAGLPIGGGGAFPPVAPGRAGGAARWRDRRSAVAGRRGRTDAGRPAMAGDGGP